MRFLKIFFKEIILSLFLFLLFSYSAVVAFSLSGTIGVKLGIECELEGIYVMSMVPLTIAVEYIVFVWTRKSSLAKKIKNDYIYVILIAILTTMLVTLLDLWICASV